LIGIIGTGRLGSNLAMSIALESLDDLTLVDVIEGLPEGDALDIRHMCAQVGSDVQVKGSNDFSALAGSDLVVVPAGFGRKPGMTRLDLLNQNFTVIRDVSAKIAKYAPEAMILMVTNPVDVMTWVALKVSGFSKKRVFGMGGLLDSCRFAMEIADKLNVSRTSVDVLVIGEHGESMLPLYRYSSVSGIPLPNLMSLQEADELVTRTRKAAVDVISKKGATVHAPVQSILKMVRAIKLNQNAVLPVSCYLEGEYGVRDVCIGVPAQVGSGGVERITELDLNEVEREAFMKGVKALKDAIGSLRM
jgi:malate dehydrogenase